MCPPLNLQLREENTYMIYKVMQIDKKLLLSGRTDDATNILKVLRLRFRDNFSLVEIPDSNTVLAVNTNINMNTLSEMLILENTATYDDYLIKLNEVISDMVNKKKDALYMIHMTENRHYVQAKYLANIFKCYKY